MKRKNYYCDEKDYRDCCWICEGWREVKIEWDSLNQKQYDLDKEYEDTKLYNYKTHYLRKVIPPEQLNFFFAVMNG